MVVEFECLVDGNQKSGKFTSWNGKYPSIIHYLQGFITRQVVHDFFHQPYRFDVLKNDKSHGFYGLIGSDLPMFGGWKNLTNIFPLNW